MTASAAMTSGRIVHLSRRRAHCQRQASSAVQATPATLKLESWLSGRASRGVRSRAAVDCVQAPEFIPALTTEHAIAQPNSRQPPVADADPDRPADGRTDCTHQEITAISTSTGPRAADNPAGCVCVVPFRHSMTLCRHGMRPAQRRSTRVQSLLPSQCQTATRARRLLQLRPAPLRQSANSTSGQVVS